MEDTGNLSERNGSQRRGERHRRVISIKFGLDSPNLDMSEYISILTHLLSISNCSLHTNQTCLRVLVYCIFAKLANTSFLIIKNA